MNLNSIVSCISLSILFTELCVFQIYPCCCVSVWLIVIKWWLVPTLWCASTTIYLATLPITCNLKQVNSLTLVSLGLCENFPGYRPKEHGGWVIGFCISNLTKYSPNLSRMVCHSHWPDMEICIPYIPSSTWHYPVFQFHQSNKYRDGTLLIRISPITNEFEHLFTCLLGFWISLSINC